MKRALICGAVLSATSTVLFLESEHSVRADGAKPRVRFANGDTNGDGARDMISWQAAELAFRLGPNALRWGVCRHLHRTKRDSSA